MTTLSFAALLAVLAAQAQPLRLVGSIALPGVRGRLDHMAVDTKGARLFVAALGNNTVEVLDLKKARREHQLGSLREPQGLVYVPEVNRIFVANGGDGTCRVYDNLTLEPLGEFPFGSDADNLRYDAAAGQVWVGYGEGALASLGVRNFRRHPAIKLDGHPESFQLQPNGPLLYVNVPDAREVEVVDRHKRAVVAKWPVPGAAGNFPMALDEAHQRLFLGCRRPARVLVLDTATGHQVAAFDCAGDADDLFYDAARRRIYVSGGEGFVTVAEQQDPDHYRTLDRIATAPGARTSLFVSALDRLYVAAPHRGDQTAEIRVFQVP